MKTENQNEKPSTGTAAAEIAAAVDVAKKEYRRALDAEDDAGIRLEESTRHLQRCLESASEDAIAKAEAARDAIEREYYSKTAAVLNAEAQLGAAQEAAFRAEFGDNESPQP